MRKNPSAGHSSVFLLTVIAFSLISVWPLFHQGLPPTHDGEYHVIRFWQFDKVLRSGTIYPRWAPDLNNGLGVPIFNYVYPLPNYAASFFHFFGLSFINAFKANLITASLAGSVLMFLWSRQFWGSWGGLASSVVYAFAPYRLLDIYVRGSVGEVWALALLPGFLWSVSKIILRQKIANSNIINREVLLSFLLLALLIFSHNILALMFMIFSLGYVGLLGMGRKLDKNTWSRIVRVFICGLGLSAVFWLPAILEKNLAVGLEVFNFKDHFPDLSELLIPSWGWSYSAVESTNKMSLQVGAVNLIMFITSLFLAVLKTFRKAVVLFFLASFLLVFILMLNISEPIWRFVPFLKYFQFPWRLLSLEIVICAFLTGFVVKTLNKKIISAAIILIAMLLSYSYTKPPFYHQRADEWYLSNPDFIYGTNSPGNAFNTLLAPRLNSLPDQKIKINDGSEAFDLIPVDSGELKFKLKMKKEGRITVNTAYFPGWKVLLNGQEAIIDNSGGLLSFTASSGNYDARLFYRGTQIQNFASVVAGIFLIMPAFCGAGRIIRKTKMSYNEL